VVTKDSVFGKIRAGDSAALAAWFEQEVGALYLSVCPHVGFDAGRAEDVVLQTFEDSLSLMMTADRTTPWDAARLRAFSLETIGLNAASPEEILRRPRRLWEQLDPPLQTALADSDHTPLPGSVLEHAAVRELVSALVATLPRGHLETFLRHTSGDAELHGLEIVGQCVSAVRNQFCDAVEPLSTAPVRNEQILAQNIEKLLASLHPVSALDPDRRAAMVEALQRQQAVLFQRTLEPEDRLHSSSKKLPLWVPLGFLAFALLGAGMTWMLRSQARDVAALKRYIQPLMKDKINVRRATIASKGYTRGIYSHSPPPKVIAKWSSGRGRTGFGDFPGKLTPFIAAKTEYDRLQKTVNAQAFQGYDQSFQNLVVHEFAAMSNAYQTIQRTYYPGEKELFKRYWEDLEKIDSSDLGSFEEIQTIYLDDPLDSEWDLLKTRARYPVLTNHLAASRSQAAYFLRGPLLTKHWSLMEKKFKLMENQAEFGPRPSDATLRAEIATLESELDATLAEEVASMAARIRELEVIWGTEQTP